MRGDEKMNDIDCYAVENVNDGERTGEKRCDSIMKRLVLCSYEHRTTLRVCQQRTAHARRRCYRHTTPVSIGFYVCMSSMSLQNA